MIEQPLLKQISSLRPNQCGHILVFTNQWQIYAQCFALCSTFYLRKSTSNHLTFSACVGLFKAPLTVPTYFF